MCGRVDERETGGVAGGEQGLVSVLAAIEEGQHYLLADGTLLLFWEQEGRGAGVAGTGEVVGVAVGE